ncbi:hypothetical protein [Brevundimonas sp.]|uniref:hypothetical protein n=1 Tax=Brevundimonas sp. TaxID=1871086 RepID=UPI0035AD8BF0
MAMEADGVVARIEDRDQAEERRVHVERRRRERRKPGTRVNREAPRRSLMKLLGAYGVGLMAAVLALTLLASEMLDIGVPVTALAFETAAMGAGVLLLAMGSLEQRLIELRLELMMLNGGRREGDRRQGDRRAGGPQDRRGAGEPPAA